MSIGLARPSTMSNGFPFQVGEQQAQARLGVRDAIEPWARQVMRPHLTGAHQVSFVSLPVVVAAARDRAGRPWATLLVGKPGFVDTSDP